MQPCVSVYPSVRPCVRVYLKHSFGRRLCPPLSIIEMHRKGDDKTFHIRPSFENNVASLLDPELRPLSQKAVFFRAEKIFFEI